MILASVNAKGVLTVIEGIKKRIPTAEKKANLDTALEVMRLSQFEVPHDEGTLQNSGAVEDLAGSSDIILGYHTKYAARLHEHPEYRFQKGRKGKYIEDPITRNGSVLNLTFGRSFQQRLF